VDKSNLLKETRENRSNEMKAEYEEEDLPRDVAAGLSSSHRRHGCQLKSSYCWSSSPRQPSVPGSTEHSKQDQPGTSNLNHLILDLNSGLQPQARAQAFAS